MIEILCKQGLNVCSPSSRQPLSTDILKLLSPPPPSEHHITIQFHSVRSWHSGLDGLAGPFWDGAPFICRSLL